MTLLITIIAAVIATVVWYVSPKARQLCVSALCYMYWGASLMWLVDAVVEYIEIRADYFMPDAASMLQDSFLGASAIALGLIIWLLIVLIKDPLNVIRNEEREPKLQKTR